MTKRIRSALSVLLIFGSRALAQSGVVDLTDLPNYANQPVPAYIAQDNTPSTNAITDSGAALGRVLFYDRRLSRNDTVSCSTCHQQAHGFSDSAVASTGVSGTTGRHSMRLINARFSQEPRFFWDERAASLEAQSTQPIRDHGEMGFSGTLGDPPFTALLAKLSALEEYRVLFAMAFGDAAITENRIQRALSQFVRSIQSFDSKYDTGRATTADNEPFPNFTGPENAGKQLFLAPAAVGGAGCAGCHRPPEFDIDPASRNNGVTNSIAGGTDLTNTRSPTLRDLVGPGGAPNGGFMHTGAFATLGAVIAHYNVIPGDNANLDPRLRRPGGAVQNLGLTPQQQANIVAFLGTLTGTTVYTDARWSNPFNEDGTIDFIILPASSVSITDNGDGTATLVCQAAPNLAYTLQTSPDLKAWTNVQTILADPNGILAKVLPVGGNAFYRFTFTPPM
jgi:cytochrome c peroxidase